MLQSTPAPAPTLSHIHSHSHNPTAHARRRRRRHRCRKRRKRRRCKLRYRRRRLAARRISPAPHRDRHHSREVVRRPTAAVTVDLITQDASQLSSTGSDDDACELACGRVLEETAGEEKGDPVGRPVGEGVAGNGPQESVSSRFWESSVGCVCASAALDGETWRISALWMMRVIERVRVHTPSPAPTEENMDVSNRMSDFVLAVCEGVSV